jgi:hypothetical protein
MSTAERASSPANATAEASSPPAEVPAAPSQADLGLLEMPPEYTNLVREAGFTDIEHHQVEVHLDQELWEAISSYGLYAQGALHFKYSAEVACRSLRQAVQDIFADAAWEEEFPGLVEDGKRFIPRQWLWVTA